MLRSLLRRFDALVEPLFPFDEVRRWPAGVLDQFIKLGLLRQIEPAATIACDGCADGHLLEVDVRPYPAGAIGVATCPACGQVRVKLDRLKQWSLDFSGLCAAVSAAVGTLGGVSIQVPDRLAFLGTLKRDGESWDLFLGRGLTWPDTAQMLEGAPRLKASAHPVILVPADLPAQSAKLPLRPAMGALAELTTITKRGLTVNLAPLEAQEPLPHPEAATPKWLTVTQAAAMHVDDVDDLSFAKAKARISKAATECLFKTNGKKGQARRIDRDSFSRWRLAQREKNLDEVDDR